MIIQCHCSKCGKLSTEFVPKDIEKNRYNVVECEKCHFCLYEIQRDDYININGEKVE